ncbi:hypothetical protein HDC90_002924 [Pedobacter sp. AK013]|nr:hypothetical protein [Pedobacter sp. AK013]
MTVEADLDSALYSYHGGVNVNRLFYRVMSAFT